MATASIDSLYGTSMHLISSQMQVMKQQGAAGQEGYRGRLKSPQRDQYHDGKTRHGKSPKIRSKPLGPCFAAGKEHQREYGHRLASPAPHYEGKQRLEPDLPTQSSRDAREPPKAAR